MSRSVGLVFYFYMCSQVFTPVAKISGISNVLKLSIKCLPRSKEHKISSFLAFQKTIPVLSLNKLIFLKVVLKSLKQIILKTVKHKGIFGVSRVLTMNNFLYK